MCLSSGKGSYDAYKSGDYQAWRVYANRIDTLQTANANGDLTHEQRAANNALIAKLQKTAAPLAAKVEKDAAARLDMREFNRHGDINIGKANINDSFESINQNYYDNYKNAYNNFYTPQLNDQYSQASGKLTAHLAGQGILEGTAGIGEIGRLAKERNTAATTIANEGQDAANKLQANVEKTKSDLYSLNEASADPQAINARAAGEATALVAPPTFSPLGQVFANFLQPILQNSGQQQQGYRQYSSPFTNASGGGSGKVYG